jgi:hypothetical protein
MEFSARLVLSSNSILQEAGEPFPKRERVLAGLAKCAGRQSSGLRCVDLATDLIVRIYLAAGVTDMRKGFEGLYGLVRDRLSCDPLTGHLFLFCNGQRNRLKVLV